MKINKVMQQKTVYINLKRKLNYGWKTILFAKIVTITVNK